MSCSLCGAMSSMSLSARVQTPGRTVQVPFSSTATFRGQAISSRRASRVAAASVFQVVAKQNSLKRQRTAERNRQYNKAHKSAVATRIRKVVKAVDEQLSSETLPTSEDAVKPIEKLISEAYKEIDKAVSKGVLHLRTAARRKAKLAAAKTHLLVTAGLYTPELQ